MIDLHIIMMAISVEVWFNSWSFIKYKIKRERNGEKKRGRGTDRDRDIET